VGYIVSPSDENMGKEGMGLVEPQEGNMGRKVWVEMMGYIYSTALYTDSYIDPIFMRV